MDDELFGDLPEIDGYERFAEAGDGGGYDWAVFGLWTKDGRFFWAGDCGCSCNSPWDPYYAIDFDGEGTVHDAIRALHRWASGQCCTNSERVLTKLLEYRVPKGDE